MYEETELPVSVQYNLQLYVYMRNRNSRRVAAVSERVFVFI